MKILILLLFLSTAAYAQLLDKGDISEIKGKTKYYLVADAFASKQINKELKKAKNLTSVNTEDAAEFFFEYKTIGNEDRVGGFYSSTGQLDVYYRRDGKKVIVWSDSDTGTNPMRSLTKKVLKLLK